MPKFRITDPATGKTWVTDTRPTAEDLDELFGKGTPPISKVEAAQKPQADEGHPWLATAARVGIPLVAAGSIALTGGASAPVAAGLLFGAGVTGELAGEALEGREAPSIRETLAAGVVNTFAPRLGTTVTRSILKGAAFGAGSTTIEAIARHEGLPKVGNLAIGALTGGVVMGGTHGAYSLIHRSAVNELFSPEIADDVHNIGIGKPQESGAWKAATKLGLQDELRQLQHDYRIKEARLGPPIDWQLRKRGSYAKADWHELLEGSGMRPKRTSVQGKKGQFKSVLKAELVGDVDPTLGQPTTAERFGQYKQGTAGALRAITPTKYWFDMVQRETGVRVYDEIYTATQNAKVGRDRVLSSVASQLETIRNNHVDDMMPVLDSLGKEHGLNMEDFIKNQLPRLRATGEDNIEAAILKAYPVEPPKETKYFTEALVTGQIGPNDSDAAKFTVNVARYVANKEHLDELTSGIRSKYLAPSREYPEDITLPIQHYLQQLEGRRDLLSRESSKLVRAFVSHLPPRVQRWYTGKMVSDYADALVSLQYMGTLGFNPAAHARNALQTFQTGFMFLGPKWHARGIARTAARGALREATELGFLAPEEYVIGEAERGFQVTSRVGSAMRKAARFSLRGYRHIDDRNRAVVAFGQYEKTLAAARTARRDATKFANLADLDAGFTQAEAVQIAKLHMAGDSEGAARLAGTKLADNTQFLYSRENKPPALTGTVGRAIGAYGTWPLWYAQVLRHALPESAGGLPGPAMKKGLVFGRWVAANTAMTLGTMGVVKALHHEATAWDIFRGTGSWLWLGPASYSPFETPIARLGSEALKAEEVFTGRRSPAAAAKGLAYAAKPFVPFSSAATHVYRGVKSIHDRKFGEYFPYLVGIQQKLPPPNR